MYIQFDNTDMIIITFINVTVLRFNLLLIGYGGYNHDNGAFTTKLFTVVFICIGWIVTLKLVSYLRVKLEVGDQMPIL